MHTASRRSLFRTPSASLQAAVFLVLSGAVAGACSSVNEDTGSTSEALTGGSACEGVQLDASRFYQPKSWTDAHVAFAAGTLTFQVPSSLAVTSGKPDHGKAKLTFSNSGGDPVVCVYRGNGGTTYDFVKCKSGPSASPDADDDDDCDLPDGPSDPVPTAGSSVTANNFTLHINKGSKKDGTTTVKLHLGGPVIDDGNACTTDACTAGGGVTHTTIDVDDHDACTDDACDPGTGPTHTLVNSVFCRGQANFNDTTLAGLGGNGRACSTCHVASDSFQLSAETAEARYQALQAARVTNPAADDPLFRPIDANDFRINGNAASDYTNLRQGLIRITFPLPANVKLLDCGSAVPCPATAQPTSETFVDVWRSVPSVFNVNITGPDGSTPQWPRGVNTRGGYQLDARVDTLQNQALGALHGHAQVAVDPPTSFLDDVAGFQRQLFSSPGVKLLSDAMTAGTTPLPDPDPVLDATETAGKAVFIRSCAQCHGGATGSTPINQGTPGTPTLLPRFQDIQHACPRPVDTVSPARFAFAPCSPANTGAIRTYQITNSGIAPNPACGGTGQPPCVTRFTSSDPGRFLLTGFPQPGPPGDMQKMDVPSLRGISHTAPYFANNDAATLEDVIDHYRQFFKSVAASNPVAPPLTTIPGGPIDRPFTDAEVPALLAYLRKL